MKKLILALGIFSFILMGSVVFNPVEAQTTTDKVQDDPPKKDAQKKSNCAEYKKDDCKKASLSKGSCCESKGMKAAKAANSPATVSESKKSEKKKSDDDKK